MRRIEEGQWYKGSRCVGSKMRQERKNPKRRDRRGQAPNGIQLRKVRKRGEESEGRKYKRTAGQALHDVWPEEAWYLQAQRHKRWSREETISD